MVLGRPIRFIVLLGAAVGIPYAWFNEDFAPSAKMKLRDWTASLKQTSWSFGSGAPDAASSTPVARRDRLPSVSFETPDNTSVLTGGINELERLLTFDITPGFIINQWSRVSTVHPENGLEGMRVALVTGTGVEDIAGSLTYYFDNQQSLRRITFDGVTGDDRPLVNIISQQFKFRPEPALGGGMYVARWNAQPTGLLKISHAPVVRSQRPHERLEVMLELNRLGVVNSLSARARETIYRSQVSNL